MGKKKNVNTKRKQREAEIVKEFDTVVEKSRKKQRLKTTNNADLFFVDDGRQSSSQKIQNKTLTYDAANTEMSAKKKWKKSVREGGSSQRKDEEPVSDIWGDCQKVPPAPVDEYVHMQVAKRIADAANVKNRRRASKNELASRAPAVRVEEPGASYNPSAEDHKNLIEAAVEIETKRILENQAVGERLKPPLPPINESLVMSDSDEEDGEEIAGKNGMSINPAVRREKKLSQAGKNKRVRHKQGLKELAARKTGKSFNAQFSQIKKIDKEVKIEEKEKEERRKEMKKLKAEKALIPAPVKYGGKIVETPFPIDAPLSEELHGSIRKVVRVGNPIRDRLHSMMQRNLVEVGKIKKNKKKNEKLRARDKKWALPPEPSNPATN